LVEEAARFATTGSAVALEFRSQPIEGALQIDPGQIMQVVHNLVLNAVQASTPGSTVAVTVAPKPAPAGLQAEIVVEDRGSGIAPEYLARIFEPYFTTRAGGSGLGLATTHSIVQRHGGQLAVDSVVGRGTRITVVLPIVSVELESSPSTAPPPARALAGLRLLVLDDEPLISRLLSRLLEGLGIAATLTERGEDTVEAFKEAARSGHPFDLVILDLTVVGGLGGRETLARLRALDPHVRALASSGYSEDDVLAQPESYGFSAILPKPYTQRALVAALTVALGASSAG
jgi:CheY-like chemotaxis protein